MKKMSREELIEKSVVIKTFVHESVIFVNIISAIRPYAFCCELEDLNMHLKLLQNYPIATRLTIDRKEIDILTVKHISVNSMNRCKITLRDGSVIEGDSLDYDAITPSIEEFKKMIFDSIETV